MDRAGQVGQEPPSGFERLVLGIDGMVDGAAAQLDLPAAEFLLGAWFAQPFHHRRAGDEHRRDLLDHDRVMRRDQSRGAEAGDRPSPSPTTGTCDIWLATRSNDVVSLSPPGRFARPGGFDGLDRSAAAGTFDQPDDRHAELGRDLLRHLGLALDGGIGGPAAEGEIVAGDDHRAAVDRAAPEHAVAWDEAGDVALRVVVRLAGDAADFLEGAGVEHAVDPLPDRQPAAGVLACDTVLAAEFPGERLALTQFGQFGFPTHRAKVQRLGLRLGDVFVGHRFLLALSLDTGR